MSWSTSGRKKPATTSSTAVGWELQRALAPLDEVIGLDHNSTALHADFSQPESLAATVAAVQPDVIVNAAAHTAAHTAVDKAESEPALARAINAEAPGVLAREAARLGATLVHYSTDYVFDGSGDQPRDESAATGPLSVYGRTKLEGEQLIQASGCRHLILRTSWVYAAHGGNFAKTMLRLARDREALTVIKDQFGAPTSAELLADVTAIAIRAALARPALAGLYHCVAGGETNWHQYACFVLDQAHALGWQLKAGPAQVAEVATAQYPTPAQRPLNSRLDTTRLQSTFGVVLPHWQDHARRMLQEITPPTAP
jgi:dTDP-4-dehydrorhamnose reductase